MIDGKVWNVYGFDSNLLSSRSLTVTVYSVSGNNSSHRILLQCTFEYFKVCSGFNSNVTKMTSYVEFRTSDTQETSTRTKFWELLGMRSQSCIVIGGSAMQNNELTVSQFYHF